ncbi:MAG: hypothetical protein HXX19_06910 [Rhodoferax sp.]|nr:hypothetical protein [Rhodoferax sp.]
MTWLARLKKQISPGTHPTEPTKPGFVGFVGTLTGHIQKIEGDALAANDPAPDPDRWCWPFTPAMNTAEIDRFTARLARFTGRGVIQGDAECLADRLVTRDREKDDRALCLECAHLQRGGCCGNWQQSGVAIRARDALLDTEFMHLLQRCDGFKGV